MRKKGSCLRPCKGEKVSLDIDTVDNHIICVYILQYYFLVGMRELIKEKLVVLWCNMKIWLTRLCRQISGENWCVRKIFCLVYSVRMLKGMYAGGGE